MDTVSVGLKCRLLFSCALVALGTGMLVPESAEAANLAASLRKDFARLTFQGAEGAKMSSSANGRQVILRFDESVPVNINGITSNLQPYIVNAQQSADKRHIVLTMKQDYPIRSFTSENSSGVDVLFKGRVRPNRVVTDSAPLPPKVIPPQAPKLAKLADARPIPTMPPLPKAKPLLSTHKNPTNVLSTKPEPPRQAVVTPALQAKLTPKPAPTVMAQMQPLSQSQKSAPIIQKAPVTKVTETVAKPAPAAVEKVVLPLLATKTGEKAPEKAPEASSLKAEITQATPKKPEAKELTREEAQTLAIARANELMAGRPMIVGTKAGTVTSQFFFPFSQRTAVASFTLGDSLYVVFNTKREVDIKNLSTVLPRFIASVQQLTSANATVLRFVTDGKIYSTAALSGHGYEWVLDVSRRPNVPKEMTVPTVITEPPLPPHVEFNVTQMAEAVRFTDPASGEEVSVVPSFEPNRGVFPERILPEVTVLRTGQGMAYIAADADLRLLRLRTGLRLSRQGGMNISPTLAALPQDLLLSADASSYTFYPYSQWKAEDNADFYARERTLFADISTADSTKSPQLRLKLAELYLSEGMNVETLGVLDIIQQDASDFYDDYQLAALRGAANFMAGRIDAATQDFFNPAIAEEEEAQMWQRLLEVLNGTKKVLNYNAINRQYVRHYPPEMRRRIAMIAADNALAQKKYTAVQKIFGQLGLDGLAEPLDGYRTYMMGRIQAEIGNLEKAEKTLQPLIDNVEDRFLRARAAFTLATAKYKAGALDRPALIAALEPLRFVWRGDAFELNLLNLLGELHANNGQYVEALRAWNDAVTYFPDTAVAQDASSRMAAAFVALFNEGKADDLTPLSALALYYEFRELTPLGRQGDIMIQHLADRLAGVDLLDRAASLLQHQVTYRLEKEERSRVGARLALIYLLNREPVKTLETLEITGYGENDAGLTRTRNHLAALSHAKLGNWQRAINLLRDDYSLEARMIRTDIYWDVKDWDNVAKSVEEILAARSDVAAKLTDAEAQAVLKLAVAYTFTQQPDQLQYVRDYFMPLMQDAGRRATLDFVTSGIDPVNRDTIDRLSAEMTKMQSFLENYRVSLGKEGLSGVFN